MEPTHQLPKQFHRGGGSSGPRRSAAVQPQACVSEVSSVRSFLVLSGTKAQTAAGTETVPVSQAFKCVFLVYLLIDLFMRYYSRVYMPLLMIKSVTIISMCELTQFTEEHRRGRRSQKDRRSTEDKPDSHRADVTFNYHSFT